MLVFNHKTKNDELVIGNELVSNILRKKITTPLFIYDKEKVSHYIKNIRDNFPNDMKIHYALKANPFPPLLSYISKLVDGMDVASKGELEIALNAGMNSGNITFAGPGKRPFELECAIKNKVTVNIESINELKRCIEIGEKTNEMPKIAFRINPNFELKSYGIEMGGGSSPFGIDAEDVPTLLDFIQNKNIHFRGFHIYSGSQSLSETRLTEMISNCFNLAKKLAINSSVEVESLNIGGGFGIPYFLGESDLDIKMIGNSFSDLYKKWKKDFPKSEVILELGRYLVGSAGIYVCTIIDKKISRGEIYLVTDGGMHHHLAASGNLGQIIRKNFPLYNSKKIHKGQRETVNIVGPLCTSLDILGSKVEIGKAEIGDQIVVLQSGAYAYSASPLEFLSHSKPDQILI